MDVVSHWFMGSGATHGRTKFWVAGAMGVLPDLLVFIPNSFIAGRPEIDDNTVTADSGWYAWEAYQVTHSLVWMTIGFLFTWIFLKSGAYLVDCLPTIHCLPEMLLCGCGCHGSFTSSMTFQHILQVSFPRHSWHRLVIFTSMVYDGVHRGFGLAILQSSSRFGAQFSTRKNELIHHRNGIKASTAAVA